MGSAISVIVAILATIAFILDGSRTLAILSGLTGFVCLWSGLHMLYFARQLARQRLFFEAVQRGEITEGTTQAERFWREMPINVSDRDVQDVPNWITLVNMLATLVAVVLLIWGGIAALM